MVTTRFPRSEVREARARADARAAAAEGDDVDEDDQTLPPTSIDDLTTEADREQFDQTFTDDDASLRLEGAFDPVAGPKQVLPRVAYTVNFNMVWNPDRQRWEPDEGNDGGGGGAPSTTAFPTSSQTVSDGLQPELIKLGGTDQDELNGFSDADDSVTVPDDGTYLLTTTVEFIDAPSGSDPNVFLEVNGSIVADRGVPNGQFGTYAMSVTQALSLSASDEITVTANQESGGSLSINSGQSNTWLSVVQLQT